MNILNLLGRQKALFLEDLLVYNDELRNVISSSSFLVLGGAGSIGQAVVKEIFKQNPRKLHVVDLSENNLVELVRDLRSSYGYIEGNFQTFALDINSLEYDAFINHDGIYDYVLNFSALKHVRSESNPFTLMRLIQTNIFNTLKTVKQAANKKAVKYFAVSTDKAANPVNMMGASKRIMELFLQSESKNIAIATARFANVAFSDGSLLHSFHQRLKKGQPIVAPNDVKRYFVTDQEGALLCLFACIFGEANDIFFPKLRADLHLTKFSDIAINFLALKGLEPLICGSENEARRIASNHIPKGKWPCYFSPSNTTGEKAFEEFYTQNETPNFKRFNEIGIVKNTHRIETKKLDAFKTKISEYLSMQKWTKADLVFEFQELLPGFYLEEKGKYLDDKM